MKRAIKILVITLLIFVVAIVAAPLFVRQEQIKNFIQNKVTLSGGSKLTVEGDIDFGIFPYSFIKIPKGIITDKNGNVTSADNIKFGFNPTSLLGENVKFDIEFKFEPTEYVGHIEFKNYQSFLRNGNSPIIIGLEKPLAIEAKADFEKDGDKITLKNIVANYKQTGLTGNFETTLSGNNQKISMLGTLNTQNLDDLRRLYKFTDNENDPSLLSGTGKLDFYLSSSGAKSSELVSNLKGEGSIDLSQAVIYGLDFSELINSKKQIKLTKNHDLKIEINKADGTFTINNGIAVTKDLKLSNAFATANANGQADFPKKTLALNIDVEADLTATKLNLPLAVSGKFDDLAVIPRGVDMIMNNVSLDKDSIKNSLGKLKAIGQGFGIDVNSIINKNKAPQNNAVPADANPAQ